MSTSIGLIINFVSDNITTIDIISIRGKHIVYQSAVSCDYNIHVHQLDNEVIDIVKTFLDSSNSFYNDEGDCFMVDEGILRDLIRTMKSYEAL